MLAVAIQWILEASSSVLALGEGLASFGAGIRPGHP